MSKCSGVSFPQEVLDLNVRPSRQSVLKRDADPVAAGQACASSRHVRMCSERNPRRTSFTANASQDQRCSTKTIGHVSALGV